mmetsp:Transcript_12672/g.15999  ORF Transcript_12672/g.15999 Transcript_12672/m.15999 type:complete len:355 (+) Transcript_12672:178-1242(+)|eukprot:CAMPEP_0172492508 /NCGR_PEP_ID=MMETSP1066-20121228/23692_1 /TAXON_ID=671091 /ORGANISM="Coscinodiscus wailesii, Strain CCMP2513" /LENGTH=354 /DNA_ID=CAMNT_0013262179 /DNA_START=166 /DNA_END=1230 /DNA_ORIENTATION=+
MSNTNLTAAQELAPVKTEDDSTAPSESPSDDASEVSSSEIILEALVKEAVRENDKDVYWSTLSNSLFLCGGVFYVIETLWDMKGGPSPGTYNLYVFVTIVGPLVYLANGTVDVMWAIRTKQQELHQRNELCHPESSALSSSEMLALDIENPTTAEERDMTKAKSGRRRRFGKHFRARATTLLSRLTRHVGHRREVSAAASFAVAAFFDVMAAVAFSENEDKAGRLGDVSIHLYLISAMFALCGRRTTLPSEIVTWLNVWWDADRLEDLGDIFFGMGSLLDVVVNDASLYDKAPWLLVFSAYLWLIDALLYLRGDYVVFKAIKEEVAPVLIEESLDVPNFAKETESIALSENVIS